MQAQKFQGGTSRTVLLIVAIVLGLALLASIQFGPELVGYYRFNRAMTQLAAEDAKAGPFPRLTDVCEVCHGQGGNPVNEFYPRLAGQPAPYIAAQLRAFASGQRANPNMAPLAADLTDVEVQRLSEFFSRQAPIVAAELPADSKASGRGRAHVEKLNCAGCHGADLEGHDLSARLAAQGEGYLVEQLEAFNSGRRKEATGAMAALTSSLAPQDVRDIAHYLAHLAAEPSEANR
jgi:cytochrome c553